MGVAISSPEELQAWLEDKPREWAQVIAVRCVLRVLPFAIDPQQWRFRRVDQALILAVLRAITLSSLSAKILPDYKLSSAAAAAADNVRATRYAAYSATNATVRAVASAARATVNGDASRAISSSVEAINDLQTASIWGELSEDCSRLGRGEVIDSLLTKPLWSIEPKWFAETWLRAREWLTSPKDGFALWCDWYERRLNGELLQFANFDYSADAQLLSRFLAQSYSWWDREPAAINAEIASWVVELSTPAQQTLEELFGRTQVDFFISYTSVNEAAAREVAAILDGLGKTFIVQFRDFAQQNFVNAMNDGLAQAERLIALYSPDYVASGHCMAEWNVFYNRDPSSAQRRIVAFKLEDVDLKPLMKPIVYRDLSRLTGAARLAAIREWITWEPTPPTRAQVEQVVTATLSPQIVETDDGKLDTQPNPAFDQPEYPAELAQALKALGMVLDVVLEDTSNLPRPMQKALDGYDREFTANGAKSSWGGLERLMTIIAGGLAKIAEAEFSEGEKEALEQLIAAHGACMAALKNADTQLRELDAIPLDGADQARIKDLVDRLKDFFTRLRNLGLTRDRLDRHVDDLVEQGRDFTFEAGEPDADQRPHARRQYLLYVGGFGLAALNALGSMASISAVPLAQEAIAAGQAMVEVFFRMVGL